MDRRLIGRMGAIGLLLAAALARPLCAEDDQRTGGLVPTQPNTPMTADGYLGAVNGEPVFVDDIFAPIDDELRRLGRVASTISEFRTLSREMVARQVNNQISDMLLLKAAKDAMVEDDTKRVDAYMNKATKDLLTEYGGSAAIADEKLRAKGSSLDKELANKRRKAITDLYKGKVFYPKIVVTAPMIRREYDRDLATKYTLAPEVDLYTITLPITRWLKEPDPEKPGEQRTIKNPTDAQIQQATNLALERARQLIALIKTGGPEGDFARLAEANSVDGLKYKGGRHNHTRKGDLARAEIEQAAFSLPRNGIAEPVISRGKTFEDTVVVIVKVGDVSPGRVVGFEEAQTEIETRLRDLQLTRLINEFYAKLRERAAIEPSQEKMVDVAADAAVTKYAIK